VYDNLIEKYLVRYGTININWGFYMEDKGSSGVTIPPPIVYFVCILIGIGLNYLWPFSFSPQSIQDPIGYSIIALSILLFGLVLREFSKSDTSTDYRKSTVAIISTGPFCYSRNPVYLSLTMLKGGLCCWQFLSYYHDNPGCIDCPLCRNFRKRSVPYKKIE